MPAQWQRLSARGSLGICHPAPSLNGEKQTATPSSSHDPSTASTNISGNVVNVPRGLWSDWNIMLIYHLIQMWHAASGLCNCMLYHGQPLAIEQTGFQLPVGTQTQIIIFYYHIKEDL